MIRSLRWGILSLSLLFISMLSHSLWAQQLYNSSITVQYPDGRVSYFETLDEAFMALKAGCVVYIPSGSYRLSSKDETKIKCQVAIYGAGCRPYGKDTDYTRIIGNLEFVEGASSSVIMGFRSEGSISIRMLTCFENLSTHVTDCMRENVVRNSENDWAVRMSACSLTSHRILLSFDR